MVACYGLSDVYPRPKLSHNAYLHVKGIEESQNVPNPESSKPILPWGFLFPCALVPNKLDSNISPWLLGH